MTGALIQGVLRGVLGGRRKRSRNAWRFLTGGRGGNPLANPSTLLTAAGVAWGIYETLQHRGSDPPHGATAATAIGGQHPPAPANIPPLPGAATAPTAPDDVVRLLRLAVSAARADGDIGEQERAVILQQAKSADASGILEQELARPRPLPEIVAGVSDPAQRATLYVLAFTILRADEHISGTERIYLAQLAHLLGLDVKVAQALEKDTGERIDALGDQGQLGG